jgi:hypothetical protein
MRTDEVGSHHTQCPFTTPTINSLISRRSRLIKGELRVLKLTRTYQEASLQPYFVNAALSIHS